ncbi:hypothetical protein BT96DRAFT_991372 [Gymnopus androsaceus JB14]|uniref:Class E vacuolar protein-sorting machinery protein HSE1 n=1 Tax=Gymnopus androsaceus JB14 TaxID=1447944 RepID=A0A6A4HZS2_9AGAR|nr:hypothetical protein BT96DRAFT_991372 [Gymnopus androsaceus JB14]
MSGMFGGGSTNAYDEIVAKTTDENLTTENWELILNLCDKVQDDSEDGHRSLLRRLSHRNPNVQLYTLSLADALSKNVGIAINRELASKAFTQGLEKLVVDRNTHEKVKRRTLGLIAEWTAEWEGDGELGVMEDLYNNLKAKNYKFETPNEPAPPAVDDEIRRKEEEELQRVLEMSMQDRGGYNSYSSWGQGTGAGSSSGGTSNNNSNNNGYVPASQASAAVSSYTAATSTPGGAASPSPSAAVNANLARTGSTISTTSSLTSAGGTKHLSNRVRALHAFTPTEPGELGFQAGDIITVVDRGYKDWWRGQLRGRTGIFPVNYVEALPPPDESELAREAREEAKVFSEVGNVEKLLEGLREVEKEWGVYTTNQGATPPQRLSDNDSLQELYRSCMALRPKIVKLIEKYSQKRADLVSMNETFVRARGIFDRLMEESLASYGIAGAPYTPGPYGAQPGYGGYGQPGPYAGTPTPGPYGFPTPGAGAGAVSPPIQGYPGPGAQGVGAYPQQPYPGPAAGAGAGAGYPVQQGQPQPQQGQPQQQQPQAQAQVQPQYGQPQQGYPTPTPYGVQPAASLSSSGLEQQQQPTQVQPQPQPQVTQQQPIQQQPQPSAQQPVQQQQLSQSPLPSTQQPIQQLQQQQPIQQSTPTPTPPSQPQPTESKEPKHITGPPPYPYSTTYTYEDPNVQAWATYYTQGGTDPTGAVYFFSVPGVKEGTAPTTPNSGSTQPQAGGQSPIQSAGGAAAEAQTQTRIQANTNTNTQTQLQPGSAVGGVSTGQVTVDELDPSSPLPSSGTVSSGHTLDNPYSPGYPGSAHPGAAGASFSLYSPSYTQPSASVTSSFGLPGIRPAGANGRSATMDSVGSGPLPYPGDSVESLPYPGEGPGQGPESPHSAHSVHSFQQQQLQQQQVGTPQSAYPGGVSLTDSGFAPAPVPASSPPVTTSSSPSIAAASTPSWVLPKIGAGAGSGRA